MGNNEIRNEIEIVKYEQEEIRKKIKKVYNEISVLSEYIYEIAKTELDRVGYKLMYRDRDGKEYPEIDEEIEWYYISTEWDSVLKAHLDFVCIIRFMIPHMIVVSFVESH